MNDCQRFETLSKHIDEQLMELLLPEVTTLKVGLWEKAISKHPSKKVIGADELTPCYVDCVTNLGKDAQKGALLKIKFLSEAYTYSDDDTDSMNLYGFIHNMKKLLDLTLEVGV
jgi:hypothetical protein